MKRFLYYLAVAGLMVSCHLLEDHHEADYFILKGKLENAPERSLTVEELTTNDLIPVDSFQTSDSGEFSYRGNLKESGYFILRLDQDNYITLVIEPGEDIFISGDAENFSVDHSIKGSEGSLLLSELHRNLHKNYKKVDSITEIFRENRYEPNFYELRLELQQAYMDIVDDQREYVKEFIGNNTGSLASIIALYQYFGNTLLLNESEHFEYFVLLSESLSDQYPTNRHVLDLTRRVTHQKRQEARRQSGRENLAVGNQAPEIVLPDSEGNMVSLSSLRGNYVLIDFWAAWCTPCRKGNQMLKQIYDKYSHLGFEIYAISLDRTREQWLQGIIEDEADWVHVSDLRFWNSPVVNLYNIEGIPHALLIDPEGRILKKDIKPDELEQLLAEIFGITS